MIFRKTIKLGCVANDCRLSIDMRCGKTLDHVLPQKRFVIHVPKRQLRLIVGMDKEIVVGLMKPLAMPKEKAFLTTKSAWLNEIFDEYTKPQRALTKFE